MQTLIINITIDDEDENKLIEYLDNNVIDYEITERYEE